MDNSLVTLEEHLATMHISYLPASRVAGHVPYIYTDASIVPMYSLRTLVTLGGFLTGQNAGLAWVRYHRESFEQLRFARKQSSLERSLRLNLDTSTLPNLIDHAASADSP